MGDLTNAHCARCRATTRFRRRAVRHRAHALKTVLSLGLWLPLWMGDLLSSALRPWRCAECGWHKPEFTAGLRV